MDNVCVFASSEAARPIAIIVPEENALRALVEKLGIANKNSDLAELAANPAVKDAVMKDLLAAGKIAGLQRIELISGVILAHEVWTPDNVDFLKRC